MARRIPDAGVVPELDSLPESLNGSRLPTPEAIHLRLLGSFGLIGRDGASIPLGSVRAQSLLAYLVLHRGVPQPRRRLSFLMWPESSEAQAHNNLRQVLHQLRRSWPEVDRCVAVRGVSLSFEPGPDIAVDVDIDEFECAIGAAVAAHAEPDTRSARDAFERAVDLYRGELLPGIDKDWIEPERHRLAAVHRRALDRLIGLLEQQGAYRAAIERCDQRLRLDPLDERVVRWSMRLHALDQDRAGALRIYQTSAALLEEELGVEPDAATIEVHDLVMGLGAAQGVADAARVGTGRGPMPEPTTLVGRRPEWAQLTAAWGRAVEGEAQLVVIGGEAGIGKTRLAVELSDAVVRQGILPARTRAYEAEGRLPFAPIADWLRSPLLGPALPRLDVGALSEISRLLPELIRQRPDLPRPSARIDDWQRQPFFQALAGAFLAADPPVLLVLDDLQWCDAGTLEWLHFLLRSDREARLLVVGTMRPDEVDRAHPLTALIHGLRDAGQVTEIGLGPMEPAETSSLAAQVAGRAVPPERARQIHLQTEGNPLFVVETIRAGLTGDGAAADSPALPARVQAVIAGRLAQLSEPARNLASLAATVGRAFPLEVLRQSGVSDEDRLVAAIDELVRRQIVREQGNGAYDFTHDKLREVAYSETSEARRRLLHRRVAEALERVHAVDLDVAAARIAAHFGSAGLADRAAIYYLRAAEGAQRIGANLEAMALLERGLELLAKLPPSADRDSRELSLQTALAVSLVATEGYGAPQVLSTYARARQLCQLLGRPPTPQIIRALALASLGLASVEECHAAGDHLMSLAEQADDPVLRVEAHFLIGVSLLMTGAAAPARTHLEAAIAGHDRSRSVTHIGLYGQDPEVVCLIRLSLDLWLIGEFEASDRRRAAAFERADELGHPFTRAYALVWDAIVQCLRGEPGLARTQADAAIDLGRHSRMPFWLGLGTVARGWARAELGEVESGIEEMHRGMADFAATGSRFLRPFQLGLLAEQYGRIGDVDRGVALIAEALAIVDQTNERWCLAELYRRQGELVERTASGAEAEALYRRAIDLAEYQGAQAFEARSRARLVALLDGQSRHAEASAVADPTDLTLS